MDGGRGGREGGRKGGRERGRDAQRVLLIHCHAQLLTVNVTQNFFCAHPVRDCRPAPMVERRAPIRIIHSEGQANSETVSPWA